MEGVCSTTKMPLALVLGEYFLFGKSVFDLLGKQGDRYSDYKFGLVSWMWTTSNMSQLWLGHIY